MMKVILIDDEPNALITLEAMLKHCFKGIDIAGKAQNAMEGLRLIKKVKPDLVFLDINMPGMDGLEMLEIIEGRNFKVIITSAYEKYALKAIKSRVFDFLLKPINMDELEKVVKICLDDVASDTSDRPEMIRVIDNNYTLFIRQDEIRFVRADGRYSKLYTGDKTYILSKNLGDLEEEMDKKVFFRVHKSFLINTNYVKNISGSDGGFIIMSDGTQIEISRRRKSDFMDFMNR